MQLDDPTPPESLPCSVHTYVRPLGRFPPDFEVRAKTNGKGVITPVGDERTLLNQLLGIFNDLFVRYDLLLIPRSHYLQDGSRRHRRA